MRKVLSNGMEIRICKMVSQESVTLLLKLHRGIADEVKGKRGITHLVEHLCFRKFRGMAQSDFYYKIEKIGGNLRGMTCRDCVLFEITVLKKHIWEAVDIIRGLFDENFWTYDDIRCEKQVVLRQLEKTGNWYHKQMMYDFFCRDFVGEPLIGKKHTILRITKDEIINHKRILFSAKGAELILVGDVSDSEIKEIENIFCDIPSFADREIKDITPARFTSRDKQDLHYYEDDVEGKALCISFDINKKQVKPRVAEMLCNALGKGLLSPLSMRLREKMGIIDEIDSGCEFYDFGGIMYFLFEASGDSATKLFCTVSDVFTEQKEKLDVRAFECAKAAFTDRALSLEKTSRDFAYVMAFDDHMSTFDEYIDRNNMVTYKDVSNAAKQILKIENATVNFYNK
ncbi:MAG: insulinase family protein [Oscillospiraceae bacterium]|nr:insulinase family protein [Oscillospiraceae bacterium]